MLKRILAIAAGVALGIAGSAGAAHFAALWGLLPGGETDRAATRVHDVLQLVHDRYVEAGPAAADDLARAAVTGMVQTLDPHSEYMSAAEFKTLKEDLSSEFGGIGVQVELQQQRVVVVAPTAGGPGEKAGIRRGDEIVTIDGAPLARPAMDAVVGKLRGKPGTKVVVGLLRPEPRQSISVTLVREKIRVESVRGARLLPGPGHTGYLLLTEFGEHTADEFTKALGMLKKQGMDSLVVDLRDNPGGLLDAAVHVAETFFKKGELIVYTQGRDPKDRDEYTAESAAPPLAIPVAVLVNGNSASAAEILAGALKDTHRAIIVGERSFGKGSVQSIFELGQGDGLRLTVARYYTPGGEVIHGHGIAPDIEVVLSARDDRNVMLQRGRPDVTDASAFARRFGMEPTEDRQLDAAVAALQANTLLQTRAAATR